MDKFGSKVAIVFLTAGILFVCCLYSPQGRALDMFSNAQTLIAVPGPTSDFNLTLWAIIGLAVLASAVGIALVLRKHLKVVVVSILVVGVVAAGVVAVWYAQPSISYWLVSADTTIAQDNSLTMYCENSGSWAATFELVLSLDNAHVSLKTSPPYQLVNDQTAKFTFTLQPGEKQSRQAWYIIDQNVTDYYIDLSFENNGASLIKSNPGGVNQVSYQKDPTGTNFTKRSYYPPP